MTKTLSTVFLIAAFWGPPIAAIVINQLDPKLGTALGVPYAFLLGLAVGVVSTLVFSLASRRWSAVRPRHIVVAAACLSLLLLFPLATQGMFSVVR